MYQTCMRTQNQCLDSYEILIYKDQCQKLGAVHTCHPRTGETEVVGPPQAPIQPGLQPETLSAPVMLEAVQDVSDEG